MNVERGRMTKRLRRKDEGGTWKDDPAWLSTEKVILYPSSFILLVVLVAMGEHP